MELMEEKAKAHSKGKTLSMIEIKMMNQKKEKRNVWLEATEGRK